MGSLASPWSHGLSSGLIGSMAPGVWNPQQHSPHCTLTPMLSRMLRLQGRDICNLLAKVPDLWECLLLWRWHGADSARHRKANKEIRTHLSAIETACPLKKLDSWLEHSNRGWGNALESTKLLHEANLSIYTHTHTHSIVAKIRKGLSLGIKNSTI